MSCCLSSVFDCLILFAMEERKYVRRRGGFSDRNNIKPISTIIQVDDFTLDTRTVLKNKVITLMDLYNNSLGMYDYDFHSYIAKDFSINLFCVPLHSSDARYENIVHRLYSLFDKGDYDEVLDAIEYIANSFRIEERYLEGDVECYFDNYGREYVDLKKDFNDLFEEECIGYRFIGDFIEPITNGEEIRSIEKSIITKYDKVNVHMKNALEFMSSRENRNYKSVITECCHALECLLNLVLNTKGLVLTDALKKYCSSNNRMHTALKESITKFYGYASDGAGLRHDTNNTDYNEGFEEAKLILVNTSSLINYIISISK